MQDFEKRTTPGLGNKPNVEVLKSAVPLMATRSCFQK